MSLHLTATFC